MKESEVRFGLEEGKERRGCAYGVVPSDESDDDVASHEDGTCRGRERAKTSAMDGLVREKD